MAGEFISRVYHCDCGTSFSLMSGGDGPNEKARCPVCGKEFEVAGPIIKIGFSILCECQRKFWVTLRSEGFKSGAVCPACRRTHSVFGKVSATDGSPENTENV